MLLVLNAKKKDIEIITLMAFEYTEAPFSVSSFQPDLFRDANAFDWYARRKRRLEAFFHNR